MPHIADTQFVRVQYATSANLDVRIALHEKYSTATKPFHEWLFDRIQLPPNARVLEIGCGSGALWQRVAARAPNGWRLTLTDFSFGMATQARANLPALVLELASAQCDAQWLPFANESFDGVLANHMLYHVPDLDRAVAEVRRILKRGGTLYAATNGETHLRELRQLISSVTNQPERIAERGFSLENGAGYLQKQFANVTVEEQPNDLRVTETQPLIDYILSGLPLMVEAVPQTDIDEFRARIQREIDNRGAFHITKAVGLFVAS